MISKSLKKSTPPANLTKLPPLSMDADELIKDFKRYYTYHLGRDKSCRLLHYAFLALAMVQKERLMARWRNTRCTYKECDSRRVHYLSMEYLMGRALSNAMLNLGTEDETIKALGQLGMDLEELESAELDAGLGNGGLGRLAACFLDSCASLQLPVIGYGIRYEYGMFRQVIKKGEQREEPDHWLETGNPWELERPEYSQRIRYGGRSEVYADEKGDLRHRWVESRDVLAVPFDVPIAGYKNQTVNTLRLWRAMATQEFDLGEFNAGLYPESVAAKTAAEHITMVLYPNDSSENGKELRLKQQYFLASASLKDVIRRWVAIHGNEFSDFAAKNCFQLNDTHPAFAVPELMRLLVDIHELEWDEAWEITTKCMAYTNHTLLPEALEKWPVRLFKQWLPRLLDVVYEINGRFLSDVAAKWPGDTQRQQRMSVIEEGNDPQVRMAYLAIIASYSINGVAALHSKLLVSGLFRDFYELWPEKFNNKTNGVTQRRWLAACNPGLRGLLDKTIGETWCTNLDELKKLVSHASDSTFQKQWQQVKRANKQRLAELVKTECGVIFNPDSLFEVQVKRMHEYKRQLLSALHVIHLYDRIKNGDINDWQPRCILFGGKAAPGYTMAKSIIKLISNIAEVINRDSEVGDKLKIAFLPDYRVSAMEMICPGTDLSIQISTAGKEASGTGNMKFMMNGALTIGTMDGANIEILEEVGEENFFLFGLDADEVTKLRPQYNPKMIVEQDRDLARVMHLLTSGHFNQFEPGIFDSIIDSILNPYDQWLVAADFRAFTQAQQQVSQEYQDQKNWTQKSILNVAYSGKFSSDRTIRQYNEEIWKVPPTTPHTSIDND
ncbi:MAG: glycogen/starch/alpha-glucan phosphorylase [Desulfobulbaceae bacterium]|nr:glycogen/starch/alpha-glucan phosphorylase [Desulfobulbaceae bacterium]